MDTTTGGPVTDSTSTDAPATTDPDDVADEPTGRLQRWFGPMTWGRVLALVLALAFVGGAIGYLVGDRSDRDPLSSTDVGFMQDMSAHHEQAVRMAILLLGKDDIDPDLKSYAMEILVGQRYEIGLMNATLDRFGHPTEQGETAMGWMDAPVPADEMPGLASDEEMAQLAKAQGKEAEALWIAMMSRHHLGGIHMADFEARHGHDRTVRNIAKAMVNTQRGEVQDLNRTRIRLGLPIPDGFTDPTKSPDMTPLSATEN
jgi:uncharacterized protein (DUF305 family)